MHRLASHLLLALLFSCVSRAAPLVPADRTAIFPADKAHELIETVCYAPPAATGYWTPTESDLVGIEDTLLAFLKSKEADQKKDWSTFRRQVTGLKHGNDTLIFIYYFHSDRGIEEDLQRRQTKGYDPDSWKKRPYVVFDGGSWFFRVLYDVKKKRFVWYESNGIA